MDSQRTLGQCVKLEEELLPQWLVPVGKMVDRPEKYQLRVKIFLFFLKGQDHLESLNATDYKGREEIVKKKKKICTKKVRKPNDKNEPKRAGVWY